MKAAAAKPKKKLQRVLPPRSSPLGDDYLLCPGSNLAHPPAYCPVMAGPRQLFVRCPIEACRVQWYLGGVFWRQKLEKDGRIGVTKAEAAELNPRAFVF